MCYILFFFNNLTNNLYFYNKKLYLILNASMRLHELHVSNTNAKNKKNK